MRPGASPSQNGTDGGAPWASATRTMPGSTRRIRHEVVPSRNTSPAMDSMAQSSLTVPTQGAVGLGQHPEVAHLGNGPAGGQRGDPGSAAAAQLAR